MLLDKAPWSMRWNVCRACDLVMTLRSTPATNETSDTVPVLVVILCTLPSLTVRKLRASFDVIKVKVPFCGACACFLGELIDLLTRVGIWTSVDNTPGAGGECLSNMWASVSGDTAVVTANEECDVIRRRMPLANFVSKLAHALTSQSPTRNFEKMSISHDTSGTSALVFLCCLSRWRLLPLRIAAHCFR